MMDGRKERMKYGRNEQMNVDDGCKGGWMEGI